MRKRPSRPLLSLGRGAPAALLGGCPVVIVAAVVVLAADTRDLAFANGVPPLEAVVELEPGERACQPEVAVQAPFGAVRFTADTGGRPGPALEVTVEPGGETAEVAAGYLSSIHEPESGPVARVSAPAGEREIGVCVRNRGEGVVALAGKPTDPAPDLALTFLRERPTTLLAQLPVALERASLFRPPFVGAWTFWLLGLLIAVAAPLSLAAALRAVARGAAAEDPPRDERPAVPPIQGETGR